MCRIDKARLASLLLLALLGACGDGSDDFDAGESIVLDFTEADPPDAEGWEAGFADYGQDQASIMEFASGHEPLPDDLEGHGLMIGATNRSDDVFMYWTGPLQGLAPNTSYDAHFRVTFATDSPSDCSGIGGAPGEAVWVKSGMTLLRPQPELNDDYWLMNIDKGNQAAGGGDAIIIGDVGNEGSDCATGRVWELKTVASDTPFALSTDADGMAWLLVGTDSGFEGRTELFYTRFEVELQPR